MTVNKNIVALHAHENAYMDVIHQALTDLQWKGDERNVQEALSVHPYVIGIKEFRTVMARLGFATDMNSVRPENIVDLSFPAVFIDKSNQPSLVRTPADLERFYGQPMTVLTFKAKETSVQSNLITGLFKRFSTILSQAIFLSLLIGLISLAPVFYNMAIYDTVLPVSSAYSLKMLCVGVLLALGTEVILRHKRNKTLSYFGARLDQYVGCSVFERLLYLPPLYTERASVSAQLARLRDFDAMREFFTGALATMFFEMPLTAFYIAVMACIAGKLAFIPILLVAAYGLLLWGMNGSLRETARKASSASSLRQEFVLETLTKLRSIRLAGLENVWQDRYKALSNDVAQTSLRASMKAQAIEVASYVLMTLGGMATLSLGVLLVINETMTAGALISSMILIWRIISPMQMCCASVTRVQQLMASSSQIQRLLSMQTESDAGGSERLMPKLKGQITFYRASIRYSPEAEPALLGVSFDIKPGQIVAIKGENGSGKSSILKLILGMYQPQGGSVRMDGIDIRQFDPIAMRQHISYVPQHVELLPGTIRDNILFADPTVTEEQCIQALRQACAWEEVLQLANGLDTVIAGEGAETISFMLTQRIGLARAYVKSNKIILFDEASHSLGKENDDAFVKLINNLRGKSTVVMATHREDHMQLADILLVMKKGELVAAGAPNQVLTALQGKRA